MDYWVVVVDDDALSLKNVRIILNDQGMKVACLRSGKALLEYMENHDPDLILLDIQMPEMGGFETLHELRKREESNNKKRKPVIFLTGENNTEVEQRGLKSGASDFIHKPFDKEILISRIKNTIENYRMVESLTEDATKDKLTGFLNKNSGTKRISALCAEKAGALIVFDLDSFKLVNDLYGHDMGDRVLETIADVFRSNIRANDIMSRIGGDEFMGFFCDLLSRNAVRALTERLNTQLIKKCRILMGDDFGIPIGISAGVVFVPEHGTDYNTLFQLADGSLYRVKQKGKHDCEVYDPDEADNDPKDDPHTELFKLTQLVEERGMGKGALILNQDAFSMNYRLIVRFIRMYKGRVKRLLVTLTLAQDSDINISNAALEFGEFLQGNLRNCDIVFQNRHNQFFIVVPEMSFEVNADVGDRLMSEWRKKGNAKIGITCITETVSYE